MMKMTLAAVAALCLFTSAAAHAGEGNGEPFPFRGPGLPTLATPRAYAADTGSDAYPDLAGRPSWIETVGGSDVPVTGSEGVVQTANSLPRGFEEGTVAYAQAQSVRRYLAQAARTVQAREMAKMQRPDHWAKQGRTEGSIGRANWSGM
jgi:hypothetical protein